MTLTNREIIVSSVIKMGERVLERTGTVILSRIFNLFESFKAFVCFIWRFRFSRSYVVGSLGGIFFLSDFEGLTLR